MSNDPLAFLNGRFVRRSEAAVACHDAGFVFGATVTDFARTYGRQLFRFPDHLARFRADCAACHIALPHDDVYLTLAAEELVMANGEHLAEGDEFALVTFATPGPLAHMAELATGGPPTVGMHTFRLPVERYARLFETGVTLAVAGTLTGSSLIPAGVKHRSRLHWWMAEKAVAESHPGAVPVLVDSHGASADAPIGAVLAVAGNVVYRSPVGSVLESVSLKVAKEKCEALGLTWTEAAYDFEGLCRPVDPVEKGTFSDRVSEVLLVGTAFGVAGVSRCATTFTHREYAWPGPLCERLRATWTA